MHDYGSQDDSFTKDDLVSGFERYNLLSGFYLGSVPLLPLSPQILNYAVLGYLSFYSVLVCSLVIPLSYCNLTHNGFKGVEFNKLLVLQNSEYLIFFFFLSLVYECSVRFKTKCDSREIGNFMSLKEFIISFIK